MRPRDKETKQGKNTQLELGIPILPVNETMNKMKAQLEIFKLHQEEYKQLNHARKIDLTMSNPDTKRVICTEFGATLDLGAVEKDNCSVENHAIICIFVVVKNGRVVDFTSDANLDQVIINDCDKCFFWVIVRVRVKIMIMYFTTHVLIIS